MPPETGPTAVAPIPGPTPHRHAPPNQPQPDTTPDTHRDKEQNPVDTSDPVPASDDDPEEEACHANTGEQV